MEWYLLNFAFKFFIALIVYKPADSFGILKNHIIYSQQSINCLQSLCSHLNHKKIQELSFHMKVSNY